VNQPARSKRGRRRRHCTCSGHTQIKWMTHCRVASCRPADTYQQRRRIEPLHPRPPAAEVRLHNWLVRGRLTPPGLYTDPQGPVGDTLTGQSNTHNLRHTTRLSPPRKHAAWPSCSSGPLRPSTDAGSTYRSPTGTSIAAPRTGMVSPRRLPPGRTTARIQADWQFIIADADHTEAALTAL
jgi:hypothetical protein